MPDSIECLKDVEKGTSAVVSLQGQQRIYQSGNGSDVPKMVVAEAKLRIEEECYCHYRLVVGVLEEIFRTIWRDETERY